MSALSYGENMLTNLCDKLLQLLFILSQNIALLDYYTSHNMRFVTTHVFKKASLSSSLFCLILEMTLIYLDYADH